MIQPGAVLASARQTSDEPSPAVTAIDPELCVIAPTVSAAPASRTNVDVPAASMDVSVFVPDTSSVPPASLTGDATSVPFVPRTSVPAFTIVSPVYVFAAVYVQRPVPAFVTCSFVDAPSASTPAQMPSPVPLPVSVNLWMPSPGADLSDGEDSTVKDAVPACSTTKECWSLFQSFATSFGPISNTRSVTSGTEPVNTTFRNLLARMVETLYSGHVSPIRPILSNTKAELAFDP